MSKGIEKALGRFKRGGKPPVSTAPDSAFDALLDQRLQHLEKQVEELKGRVNGLLFGIVVAVGVQIVLGFLR